MSDETNLPNGVGADTAVTDFVDATTNEEEEEDDQPCLVDDDDDDDDDGNKKQDDDDHDHDHEKSFLSSSSSILNHDDSEGAGTVVVPFSEVDALSMSQGGTSAASEELTMDSRGNIKTKTLSPLGKVIRKCVRELQADDPPISEHRCQLILQSLWNILSNKTSHTIVPTMEQTAMATTTTNLSRRGSSSNHSNTEDTSSSTLTTTGGSSTAVSSTTGTSSRTTTLLRRRSSTATAASVVQETTKRLAIDCHVIEAITHCMRCYKTSSKIQSRAILLLGAFGEECYGSIGYNEADDEEEGAGHTTDTDNHHHNNPDYYRDAVAEHFAVSYILSVFATPPPSLEQRRTSLSFGISSSSSSSSSSNHRKHSQLCMEACSTLLKLCHNHIRNTQQFCCSNDGVTTLRQIMIYHSKNVAIQQYSIQLLTEMASFKQPSQKQGSDNHDMSATKTQHSSSSSSASNSTYPFLQYMEDPELLETLVENTLRHKKVKPILQQGSKLLCLLTLEGSPRTLNALVWNNQSINVIIKSMKVFKVSQDHQIQCLMAIQKLIKERPEARDLVVVGSEKNSSGIHVILEGMIGCSTSEDVQIKALYILYMLCGDPSGSYKPTILKVLKRHSNYRDAIRQARTKYSNTETTAAYIVDCYNEKYGMKK